MDSIDEHKIINMNTKKIKKNADNIEYDSWSGYTTFDCPYCGKEHEVDDFSAEYGDHRSYEWEDIKTTISASCCDENKLIHINVSEDGNIEDGCPFEEGDYLSDGVYWRNGGLSDD